MAQAQGRHGDASGTVPLNGNTFLSDVSDVADQTGTVRGRIERVEMSSKTGFQFHMWPTGIQKLAKRSQKRVVFRKNSS